MPHILQFKFYLFVNTYVRLIPLHSSIYDYSVYTFAEIILFMILYRAGSDEELANYNSYGIFQTGPNTLEGKQFFRTEMAVLEFAGEANRIGYEPPYTTIFSISINEPDFNRIPSDRQVLDSHEAITVSTEHLAAFNNCINFTETYAFQNNL